jgi:hypothetical protein
MTTKNHLREMADSTETPHSEQSFHFALLYRITTTLSWLLFLISTFYTPRARRQRV